MTSPHEVSVRVDEHTGEMVFYTAHSSMVLVPVDERCWYVRFLSTRDGYEGQGRATALFAAMTTWADANAITLDGDDFMAGGLALAVRHGFSNDGSRLMRYPGGEKR